MVEDELRALQDPVSWDFENPEVARPVAEAGAVVSVRFTAEEFERVAARAALAGVTLAGFVHDAALQRVAQQSVR